MGLEKSGVWVPGAMHQSDGVGSDFRNAGEELCGDRRGRDEDGASPPQASCLARRVRETKEPGRTPRAAAYCFAERLHLLRLLTLSLGLHRDVARPSA
jgi:hypothetical protein